MGRAVVGATLAAVVACALACCGTMRNLEGGKGVPYGGVADDLQSCQIDRLGSVTEVWGPVMGVVGAALYCFNIVDIPLSAIGDTLTLPWTSASNAKPPEKAEAPGGVVQP